MPAAGTVGPIHRLQLVWTRAGGDDVGITTHDFRQVDSVFPDAGTTGLTHNYASLEGIFITWWNAIRAYFPPGTFPKEARWYRNDAPVPDWGEPARVTDITASVSAGSSASPPLPGQVACSITERVDSRRHWGRFYLPGLATNALGSNGRYTSAMLTTLADQTQTLYNAINTRGLKACVLGSLKSGTSLALLPGTSWIGNDFAKAIGKGMTETRVLIAYDVRQIRVDDVPDIIRRRRVAPFLIRLDRTIT